MTPIAHQDVDYFRSIGITFLSSFLGGASGVKARYDLPKLHYAATISDTRLEAIVEKLNFNLKATYEGCGYYARCPQGETTFAGTHQFVLFADDMFYDDYMSGVLA